MFRINWQQGIQLKMNFTSISEVILHNKNDLSTSQFIHSKFRIDFMSSQRVEIRSNHFVKEPTRSRPCRKLWQKACEEVERHEAIGK